MLLFQILTLVFLLLIGIEDFRSRSVHWFLFPLLTAALLMLCYHKQPLAICFIQALQNTIFILVQLGIITLYFSVKNRRFVNITDGLLGWGDILFLLSMTLGFSLVNFVLYYITSLVLSLVIWGLFRLMVKTADNRIPLAGIQACLSIMLFLLAWANPFLSLHNDNWAINLLYA